MAQHKGRCGGNPGNLTPTTSWPAPQRIFKTSPHDCFDFRTRLPRHHIAEQAGPDKAELSNEIRSYCSSLLPPDDVPADLKQSPDVDSTNGAALGRFVGL
jgi:hypothetical protein